MKHVVLLDSHAIIHRAYHALPDFSNAQGEPTGALYGLCTMIIKAVQDIKPDYIIAASDMPHPTYRHDAFEAYKGTRTQTDDALTLQLERSKDVYKALSIPLYELPGFEADDILGTISTQLAKEDGVKVTIVSGDMDTLQLIQDDTVVVYTLKKGTETVTYNEAGVIDRFGFTPERIPDYKGLRGDPSDNIPGVPGIGEKTATTLITTFGSLEGVYQALHANDPRFKEAKVTERIQGLLREHEEDARFSMMLATINCDVPVTFNLPEKSWKESVNTEALIHLMRELEFKTPLERLLSLLGERAPDDAPKGAPIDAVTLRELEVGVWLINSSLSAPTHEDILRTLRVTSLQEARAALDTRLEEENLTKVFEDIERPLIPIIKKMNAAGVYIDQAVLAALTEEYRGELQAIEQTIFTYSKEPFNVASPKQLSVVLFEELGLGGRGKKTATGMRSTKESELEKMRGEHPIIEAILEYREIAKLLGTYLVPIPGMIDIDGRLRTTFIQTGTTTGRMASHQPNLQNIPIKSERGKRIRAMFIAAPGKRLVSLDYSQIELRVAAILSQDPSLTAVFVEGRDIHQEVASRVFNVPRDEVTSEMRRRAKIINFGILYGMGVQALRQNLGTTKEEAQTFLEDYFKAYPILTEFIEATREQARVHGYTTTLFGRKRRFEDIHSSLPYIRAQAERMAVNAPIQGTQADIIKRAMVVMDPVLEKLKARVILQVHDEVILEVPEETVDECIHQASSVMTSVLNLEDTFGIPLQVDASSGISWGDL